MKRRVIITQEVVVEIDHRMFNAAFLKEFRASFFPFMSVEEHVKHLAQLHVRGLAHNGSFIEGYGDEFRGKIRFSHCETTETEVLKA